MPRFAPRTLAAVCCFALWSPAPAAPPDQRPAVVLGGGAVAAPSPYRGVASNVTAIPFINLNRGRFYLRGIQAGWRLTDRQGTTLAAVVQPQLQSYSPNESPALAGMDHRQWSVDGGLQLSHRAGRWQLSLRAVHDLLGRHQGLLGSAGVSYDLGTPKLSVAPGLGVEWEGADFVDYYYGVRPGEARSGRPGYDGRAAANPYAALRVRYSFNRHWGVFTYLRHSWLDEAITDSPIVGKSTVYSGVAAVTYSFF